MITSAANRRWDGDVSLENHYQDAGLPAPSVIRPVKIATIEAAHALRLGRIAPHLLVEVSARLRHQLGHRATRRRLSV